MYFVNTNLPRNRVRVLLSEKELSGLTDNSPNIFKKLNIDNYMERPSATLNNVKHNFLNNFCFAKLLA